LCDKNKRKEAETGKKKEKRGKTRILKYLKMESTI